jgi:hypothetical protein
MRRESLLERNPRRNMRLGLRASHARGRWFEPSRAHFSPVTLAGLSRAGRPPLGCPVCGPFHPRRGRRRVEPFHPASARRLGELAPESPSTASVVQTCRWRFPPVAVENGPHGGALPLPPQRLPRPLQASRRPPACDRAPRLASWSRRASSGDLPPRESTRPNAGRWTIFRRRATRPEFPALASERRFARVAGGACAARLHWVAPKRVRTAVQAGSVRHSAGSVAATEPDRWIREQSGPVATSRPLAVPGFSFVPRCPSLNSLQDRTARARWPVIQTNPLRISTRGPAERIMRSPSRVRGG